MRKKLFLGAIIVLAAVLFFTGITAAQNIPIDEVTKITVDGNQYVSDFEILTAVTTEVGDQTCLLYTSPSPRDS